MDITYDSWKIRETNYEVWRNLQAETIFSLGNGYMGMRGSFEEGYFGPPDNSFNATYINGFYDEYKISYPEDGYGFARRGQAMLNVPDAKIIEPVINGCEFNMFSGRVHSYQRILDMRNGFLERKVLWESPNGDMVEIDIKRLISFKRHHVAVVSCTVKPLNGDMEIEFISKIDGAMGNTEVSDDMRVGSGLKGRTMSTVGHGIWKDGGWIEQKTTNSGLYLLCGAKHETNFEADMEGCFYLDVLEHRFTAKIKKGEEFTIVKYITCYTSMDATEENLKGLAEKELKQSMEDGLAVIEKEQRQFLDEFWKRSDIMIEGDDAIQQGIRFCMFSLLQSLGRDGKTNIAAKGLTGEGYGGHYFWDSDIYIFPFFLYTNPDYAKLILKFRYNLLDAARERATELGHKGALYPWRTITGPECSAYFPAGTAQYHIDADITYAIKSYVMATGDRQFLIDMGAEIIFETARFWMSIGDFIPAKGGKFCINCVTGPDEYTALVDNNAYTNYMAKMNFEYAVSVAKWLMEEKPEEYRTLKEKIRISEDEIILWEKAACDMYLPNDESGIIPQDDGFLYKKRVEVNKIKDELPLLLHRHYLDIYRYQLCKQPDVLLMMFLLSEYFKGEDIKKNYDFYAPITTHDSSLSPSIFSIMARESGYFDEAYDFLKNSVRMDLDDVNGNTKDGIHAANMGGAWMALTMGAGGFRVYEDGVHFKPVLYKDWSRLCFKVRYRERSIMVDINRNIVKYTLIDGNPLTVYHYDEKLLLKPAEDIVKEYKDVKV
ncbi:glycoside hydrolase family 65 protein [Calorimonas adulescens]|uniref:Glycoside hydrolase family 65 protein n=1 Tax=Calorimonas adulescens TaxID=2606906 RepID=A0A5D8QCP1_9THEO|nr:glycosyl hydrolase family 65 protein [Calorimonas adulescens]TZE82311.1 glycoside hydrolase family 65 protein [Calorimonas adulescens]